MPLHVSSTSAHRQEVKIVSYSLWYHHTEGNGEVLVHCLFYHLVCEQNELELHVT